MHWEPARRSRLGLRLGQVWVKALCCLPAGRCRQRRTGSCKRYAELLGWAGLGWANPSIATPAAALTRVGPLPLLRVHQSLLHHQAVVWRRAEGGRGGSRGLPGEGCWMTSARNGLHARQGSFASQGRHLNRRGWQPAPSAPTAPQHPQLHTSTTAAQQHTAATATTAAHSSP